MKENDKFQIHDVYIYCKFLKGKAIRPKLTLLMSDAINHDFGLTNSERLREQQRKIALVSEMYHTASLIHDDIIDR